MPREEQEPIGRNRVAGRVVGHAAARWPARFLTQTGIFAEQRNLSLESQWDRVTVHTAISWLVFRLVAQATSPYSSPELHRLFVCFGPFSRQSFPDSSGEG